MNGEQRLASSRSTIQPIIAGNIQAIDQALVLIQQLSDAQYTSVQSPYVTSSIGQHIRHVVDVFFAVTRRSNPDVIDYDVRRRGAEVETSRKVALEELRQVREWMSSFEILPGLNAGSDQISILTEVTIEETCSVELRSSISRELVFASSHAVHHFALISVIAKLQDIEFSKDFGLAPATATFIRSESQEKEKKLECVQ